MSTLASRFTLSLPDYWTPEQALAVYELLNDLAEAIWNRYEIPLIELLVPDLDPGNAAQPDLFDFDDPLPFWTDGGGQSLAAIPSHRSLSKRRAVRLATTPLRLQTSFMPSRSTSSSNATRTCTGRYCGNADILQFSRLPLAAHPDQ